MPETAALDAQVDVCDADQPVSVPLPPTHRNHRLTLSQLLFINAFLAALKDNGGEPHGCARKAYLSIHPKSKPESADSQASSIMRLEKVKEAIATRVRHQQGITRELCESSLLTAQEIALKQGKPEIIASVTMDCAKLAGYLVERREVTTVDDSQKSALSSLVGQALRQAGKDGKN